MTLVIDGQYGDGVANYDCGDFTLLDGQHNHLPHSEADEGCLVFTIVDKPLYFTSGIARLLNPFSHLFF
jgi:putative transcriptional regulator